MTTNTFAELSKVDCSKHTEKKGKFTYLSWPFAFTELFTRYPDADIEIQEWEGFPAVRGGKGWMVKVSVTIKGIKRTQWHPVLDNNNRPILEPSVFELNTSIQRATVKAIALHGLGLYIYAGEDIPSADDNEPSKTPAEVEVELQAIKRKAEHDRAYAEHQESVTFIKERIAADDLQAVADEWAAIPTNDQMALWLATSKGGIFTTEERKTIKEKLPRATERAA
jgi:hypothetical protein